VHDDGDPMQLNVARPLAASVAHLVSDISVAIAAGHHRECRAKLSVMQILGTGLCIRGCPARIDSDRY
jgi:hypothetical protein